MKKIAILGTLAMLLPLTGCANKTVMERPFEMKEIENEITTNLKANSSKDGHSISLACDEDFSTYWESDTLTNAVIDLDLGSLKRLNNVTQVFNQDDIWYFRIEASVDGETYFTLLDNSFGVYGQTFSESISGYARFVKLAILKSHKGFYPSSKEFYVDTSELEEGSNIALGLKGDSSSQQKNYTARNVFDGDHGTFWCANSGGYPQWVSGEWQEPVYAKTVELFLQDYGNYIFRVEVRDTEGVWSVIQPTKMRTGNYFKFNIEKEIDAIVYHTTGGPGWANMAQIKVNGFENITSLIGKEDCFVNYVKSNNSIEISKDGKTYSSSPKNNINSVIKGIKNLASEDKVYGYSLTSLLNFNFAGKMSTYSDETHHISQATLSNRNVDYAKTYYQSELKGEVSTLEFDLGKECLISSFVQEFNEYSEHKFLIEVKASPNSEYEIVYDARNNNVDDILYECKLSETIKASGVKVTFYPGKDEYATSRRFHIYGNGSSRRENWWQDTSGVIRFYPKEQQSTLREITSRLDEFRYSGYRVIELHQPYEGKADIWAGLGATNNYQVDPIIGHLNDLTTLLKEAHSKGIKVFMFGNVGYGKANSDVFIKAQKDYALGINSREVNYFLFSDKCPDPSKWFWSDIANAYYYGFWGEDGQIPTYNFNNIEWQEETYNYIKFWAEFGLDGIALDAPDVYYFGSTNREQVTFKTITSTLRKNNLFSLPEGGSNSSFIADYKYSGIQNYNMTTWGAGALSLGLCAAQKHTADEVDGYVKGVRDLAVAVGGIAIDGMNFEDVYDDASTSDRILENALATTTGHMAFLHLGSSAKIGQDMMKEWPVERQFGVAKSFALQNSLSALNATGERAWLSTNSDYRYYAFYRSNMNGNNKSLVVFNYQNYKANIQIDLGGCALDGEVVKLYDAFNDEYFILRPENGVITLPVNANSHRVLIVR